MAWETIQHRCGHEERHQLYGPRRDREWKAKRLTERECEPCDTARVARERAEAAAAAEAAATAQGLPALTGSPKQVAWAETVRQALLARLDAACADAVGQARELEAEGRMQFPAGAADRVALAALVLQGEAVLQTAASWWIDRRDCLLAGGLYESYRAYDREVQDALRSAAAAGIAATAEG